MKQTSLLSFFNKDKTKEKDACETGEKEELYKYFYLMWDGKKPKIHGQILKDKPLLINFRTSIICEKHEIILCGYFPNVIPYKLEKEKKYKNVGFLKSLLQKAIRRCNPEIAVKCAYIYILLDLEDFLRRLPIIIIEDTNINDNIVREIFPTLIWLMIVSTKKDFIFSKEIYEYLMGVVYVMAQIPEYTKIDNNKLLYENEGKIDDLIKYHKKEESIISLLYSLKIRKAYGGMKCDLIMLENSIKLLSKPSLNKMKIRPIMLESISQLTLNEWIIEAIDFHCVPQILTYINEEYPEYDEEYIKKLIWNYSSKINLRIKEKDKEDNESIKDWEKIKKYVYRVQHYLLEENY